MLDSTYSILDLLDVRFIGVKLYNGRKQVSSIYTEKK